MISHGRVQRFIPNLVASMIDGLTQTGNSNSYSTEDDQPHGPVQLDSGLHGYDDLLNNPFVGIFRCRLHSGDILAINQKALELFHIPAERYTRISLYDVLEQYAGATPILRNPASYRKTENQEIAYSVNGDVRWLSLSYQSYPDNDILKGIVLDITEKKRQEQTLKSIQEEMDLFIYHASHQIKSPLTTILGATYLVKRDNGSEQAIHFYSGIIEDQVKRLDNIFKELMHVYSNSQVVVQRDLIDFHSLIENLMIELGPRFPDVRVSYGISAADEFYGDSVRLRLLLQNLISNAMKFQKPGESNPWISVRIETSVRDVVLTVEDNGIGIDEQTRDQDIFKIFFKGSEISKKGFGIGLFLVKNIVEKLEGTIQVKSSANGSTFQVTIPNGKIKATSGAHAL